jgi:hypothetical protein
MNHVETAGNKLYDAITLLQISETWQMSPYDRVRLSRVVRHALTEVSNGLCGECTHGDLVPVELRERTLQRAIQRLGLRRGSNPFSE